MNTLLHSFFLVSAAEMGDKTQLLALSLNFHFKKKLPIISGICLATLLNHSIASKLGGYVSQLVEPNVLKIGLAATFVIFALFVLKKDHCNTALPVNRHGAFLTTLILFFLVEMGDKTQIATVALSAKFQDPIWVTVGTTLGILFADGLAVVFGERLLKKVPFAYLRAATALLFCVFGLSVFLED